MMIIHYQFFSLYTTHVVVMENCNICLKYLCCSGGLIWLPFCAVTAFTVTALPLGTPLVGLVIGDAMTNNQTKSTQSW